MSTLLHSRNISLDVGNRNLFDGISLTVNTGDRIGLIGENGSGKSTLLRVLNRTIPADRGEVIWNNSLHLATVEQFVPPALLESTLFDALRERLGEQNGANDTFLVASLLAQMGFSQAEFTHQVADLSGGQQNRLMFARAVITEPNVILFDEPTNHLDLRSILFFEAALTTMRAAFVLISHDRAFLDAVTGRTLFLRDRRIYDYGQPYSRARELLEADDASAASRRRSEERTISSLKESAKRIANWSRINESEKLARKARSMERRIEKLESDKTFVTRESDLHLTLGTEATRANRVLSVENHQVSYGDTPLFDVESLIIRPGDRVALLGHNGTGKSTFIRTLVNRFETDREGTGMRFNPQCKLGYYDQEMMTLDPALSLLDTVRQHTTDNDHAVTQALIGTGFPYAELGKTVSMLSGGERARLMFLCIRLQQPNFLILDEPTNHIDIAGKESLEAQLIAADATLLITSHDRRFVEAIANRYVVIEDGHLVEATSPLRFHTETITPAGSVPADSAPRVELQEEDLLSRLVELESLLAADQARKQRFQKPAMQAQWQAEIAELYNRLDQDL